MGRRRIVGEAFALRGHLKNESQHTMPFGLGNQEPLVRYHGLYLNQQRNELRAVGYVLRPCMRCSHLCSLEWTLGRDRLGKTCDSVGSLFPASELFEGIDTLETFKNASLFDVFI